MKSCVLPCLIVLCMVGCNRSEPETESLIDARKGFATKGTKPSTEKQPAPAPPAKIFTLVKYESPVGKLSAYLTPDPMDGKKHPAIIWITGGDCNSIDDGCWKPSAPANDQSASEFRKAGIVMMFPSLRGGNDNPGNKEGFMGEVDDVLAAGDYLSKQSYVDPARIYLGGHSTGGTLVLLVSECSDRFRAVFSFGPADDIAGYGGQFVPAYDTSNRRETELRSPGRWLESVKSPTFVIEGEEGNIDSLRKMAKDSKNPNLSFYPVKGANHFSVLVPVTKLLAGKIIADFGAAGKLSMTEAEVAKAVGR